MELRILETIRLIVDVVLVCEPLMQLVAISRASLLIKHDIGSGAEVVNGYGVLKEIEE